MAELTNIGIFLAGLGISGLITWGVTIGKVSRNAEDIKEYKNTRLPERVGMLEKTCHDRKENCDDKMDSCHEKMETMFKKFDILESQRVEFLSRISQTIEASVGRAIGNMVEGKKK